DKAGRGGTRKVKSAFESVERAYAGLGHTLQRPVSAEIVAIPIMGASKSLPDRHTPFVSVRAVESGLLDGLVAHEVGHMLRPPRTGHRSSGSPACCPRPRPPNSRNVFYRRPQRRTAPPGVLYRCGTRERADSPAPHGRDAGTQEAGPADVPHPAQDRRDVPE